MPADLFFQVINKGIESCQFMEGESGDSFRMAFNGIDQCGRHLEDHSEHRVALLLKLAGLLLVQN